LIEASIPTAHPTKLLIKQIDAAITATATGNTFVVDERSRLGAWWTGKCHYWKPTGDWNSGKLDLAAGSVTLSGGGVLLTNKDSFDELTNAMQDLFKKLKPEIQKLDLPAMIRRSAAGAASIVVFD
jgi:hypothetical protein